MGDKFNLSWFLVVLEDDRFKMFANHGGQFTVVFTQLRLKEPRIRSPLPGGCDWTPLWARTPLNPLPFMKPMAGIPTSALHNYLKFLYIKSSGDFPLQNYINNIYLNLIIKNDSNLST